MQQLEYRRLNYPQLIVVLLCGCAARQSPDPPRNESATSPDLHISRTTTFRTHSSDSRYMLRVFPAREIESAIRHVDFIEGNSQVWSGYVQGGVVSTLVLDCGNALVATNGELRDSDDERTFNAGHGQLVISNVRRSGEVATLQRVSLRSSIDAGYEPVVRGSVTSAASNFALLWYSRSIPASTTWSLFDLNNNNTEYSRTYDQTSSIHAAELQRSLGAIQLPTTRSHIVVGRRRNSANDRVDVLSLLSLANNGDVGMVNERLGLIGPVCAENVRSSWNAIWTRCLSITLERGTIAVLHDPTHSICGVSRWRADVQLPATL